MAIDILIVVVFIISLIYGVRRGVVVQLGSVGGVLLGIVACHLFCDDLAKLLAGSNPDANDAYISGVFAAVILFITAYFLARIVAHLIKGITHTLRLSALDRIGGAVFSIFEWFFVFSLLLNIWQAFRPDIDVTKDSKIADGRAAAAVVDFAPKVLGSETYRDLAANFSKIGNDDASADK